jgi:peptidoglycan/LPS O-acetylase OafA/YrhL
MLKITDRIFGWLLVVGSCGHTLGTIIWLPAMIGIFIWSLGSSLAAGLCAALNVVRAGRPDDKTLAAITTGGTACWAVLAFCFGKSIGNVFDPRALFHMLVAIVLVVFGGMTLFRGSQTPGLVSALGNQS